MSLNVLFGVPKGKALVFERPARQRVPSAEPEVNASDAKRSKECCRIILWPEVLT